MTGQVNAASSATKLSRNPRKATKTWLG